jgi:serine/threonine protein kinase
VLQPRRSLGCVAFFLLTGKPPFSGDNLVQVCADHIHRAPDAPSAQAPSHVSSPLDALVLRCLAKAPEERPGMIEIHELLAQAADRDRTELRSAP